MRRRNNRISIALGAVLAYALTLASGCRSAPVDPPAVRRSTSVTLDVPMDSGAALDAGSWIDCVDVLHVVRTRGYQVANARRFGEANPSARTSARLSDLADADLRAFCDWEACVRTNGYAHVCWVNDAGWERCRVCAGGPDCDGLPLNQDDCVAHAGSPQRSQCNVGLLQECLLQQALRGPADTRVTQTCRLSAQACAGQLPGDLSSQALAAQHETDQVTMEACYHELDLADQQQDASYTASIRMQLAAWEGGLPADDLDAGADADGGD